MLHLAKVVQSAEFIIAHAPQISKTCKKTSQQMALLLVSARFKPKPSFVWSKSVAHTANIYSQTAVEVHSKTCLLSKSTDLWLQFFYKYFIVLVANNNCYYYRYFNAFVNAGKLKCKVQLITALWNTEKLM